MKKRVKYVSEENKQKMREEYNQYTPHVEISKRVGVPVKTVAYILRGMERNILKVTPEQLQQIKEMYKPKITQKQIAKKYGISVNLLYKILYPI
jgi:hypothetical protein